MRTVHTSLLIVTLATALGGRAQADRFTRAESLFKASCVSCHTLGWGSSPRPQPKKIDLTGVTSRMDGATLRRFLAEPTKERPGTRCLHPALPRDAVDDLLHFFQMHGRPPPAPQVTPPRSPMRHPGDPRPAPPERTVPKGGA